MFITAEIIGMEYREFPSDMKMYYQAILYIRDVDRSICVYEGHVFGDKLRKFKVNDIVTFEILGIHGNKRQVCLSLEPQECNQSRGAGDGGRAFTREPPSPEPRGATPSNTAPPKYIRGVSNGF